MFGCNLHVENVAFTIKFEFTMHPLDYNSMSPPNTGWRLGIIGSCEVEGGTKEKIGEGAGKKERCVRAQVYHGRLSDKEIQD